MDIVKANIVTSTAGRDKGEAFFVLATEGDFLLLADGKTRPVERPKRKRRKHHIPSRHWKWTHDLSAYFRKAQNEFHQDSARR